jgi:phospholipid/cholesterol/gamma-HCH transport system substrate-binding protein
MKQRSNDVIVGGAVIVIVILMIASILWVQQSDLFNRQHETVVRARDVGETRVGNAVVIRGVVSGTIQSIELAPAGWVQIHLRLDKDIELPADPVVLFSEASMFGTWQATILERGALPLDENVQKAIVEASGQKKVLAGAALPGLSKLTAVAGQIAGDVAGVAKRVKVAFDDQAAQDLRASIRSVADVSNTLAKSVRAHRSDLDTIAVQLRSAVSSLNATALTVQKISAQVDTSASTGDLKKIVTNIAAASGDLRQASVQVRDLSERFIKTQARIDVFLADGDSVMVKVNRGQGTLGLLVNDPSLFRRSDSLLVKIDALIADIKANPRRYVKLSIF